MQPYSLCSLNCEIQCQHLSLMLSMCVRVFTAVMNPVVWFKRTNQTQLLWSKHWQTNKQREMYRQHTGCCYCCYTAVERVRGGGEGDKMRAGEGKRHTKRPEGRANSRSVFAQQAHHTAHNCSLTISAPVADAAWMLSACLTSLYSQLAHLQAPK